MPKATKPACQVGITFGNVDNPDDYISMYASEGTSERFGVACGDYSDERLQLFLEDVTIRLTAAWDYMKVRHNHAAATIKEQRDAEKARHDAERAEYLGNAHREAGI